MILHSGLKKTVNLFSKGKKEAGTDQRTIVLQPLVDLGLLEEKKRTAVSQLGGSPL